VVIKNPDLWIQKQADQESPLMGEKVTYTLTITNK
jgi:hypothetical protein